MACDKKLSYGSLEKYTASCPKKNSARLSASHEVPYTFIFNLSFRFR